MSSLSDVEDEPQPEEPVLSDEEADGDFEPMQGSSSDQRSLGSRSLHMTLPSLPELDISQASVLRPPPTRSGSMATVKLQRRARLAEKLRDIFDLKGIEEVVAGKSMNNTIRFVPEQ